MSAARDDVFSLSSFSVRGRVSCFGHGSSYTSPLTPLSFVSAVTCECQHNTFGTNCQTCAPTHNDGAFVRGDIRNAHPCLACQCYNRSRTCQYDSETESGVCDACADASAGPRCDTCTSGFFRAADTGLADTPFCEPCDCHMPGVSSDVCVADRFSSSTLPAGRCLCRDRFVGVRCDTCEDGFYYDDEEEDCVSCTCNARGSLSDTCDSESGQCPCRVGYADGKCSSCADGYFRNLAGDCVACNCVTNGTVGGSALCSDVSGQCTCLPLHEERDCATCAADSFRSESGRCQACDCFDLGSASSQCDSLGKCDCITGGLFGGAKCDECGQNFKHKIVDGADICVLFLCLVLYFC